MHGYENAEAWLRLVVTRLVTDRGRRLRVRRAAPAAEPDPVGPPGDDHVWIVRALKGLPLDQRRALVLHYLLDRPIAEIAAETGPTSTQ